MWGVLGGGVFGSKRNVITGKIPGVMVVTIRSYKSHNCAYISEGAFLPEFLAVLKRTLQNCQKIWKKYFLIAEGIMNTRLYEICHNNLSF